MKSKKYGLLKIHNRSFLFLCSIFILSTVVQYSETFDIVGVHVTTKTIDRLGNTQFTISCEANGYFEWCKFEHNGKVTKCILIKPSFKTFNHFLALIIVIALIFNIAMNPIFSIAKCSGREIQIKTHL